MHIIRQFSGLVLVTVYFILAISSFNVAFCGSDGWEKIYANKHSSIIPLHRYGGKSYYMGTQFHATYFEALMFCEQIKMKLLTIRSADENERIHKYIREASKGTEYWTADTRLVDGFNFLWLPYGEPVNYTKWSNGQPSDVNEKCLQLWMIGDRLKWNDRPCDIRFNFICDRFDCETAASV
nr:C-type lectin mannose-binding isoform-like [Leptinotarsa decemlineata]